MRVRNISLDPVDDEAAHDEGEASLMQLPAFCTAIVELIAYTGPSTFDQSTLAAGVRA